MRRSKLLPGLACLGLLGCAPSEQLTPAERAVEEQMLAGRVTAWEQAVNSRNFDSVTMFYHKDPGMVGLWSEGRRAQGWEAESTVTVEFLRRTTDLNFDIQDPSTQILSRSVALTTFRHAIDLTDSVAGRQLYSGFGTLVWVKDPADGEWKIHSRQISRNPPPPAQPAGRRR